MTKIYPTDPRFYVQQEFDQRHQRNAAYSWRSFARDLRLSPSMLSEFLKGRYGLSRAKALHVATVLRLDEENTQHFVDLLEAEFHRSPSQRRLARLRLSQRHQSPAQSALDWPSLAALEVAALEQGHVCAENWCVELNKSSDALLADLQAKAELGLDRRPFHDLTVSTGELSPAPIMPEREELNVFARVARQDLPALKRELNDAFLKILNDYSGEDADSVYLFYLHLGPVYRKGQFSSSV
jgi:transcriptional regulator with XRE-family HTH domain